MTPWWTNGFASGEDGPFQVGPGGDHLLDRRAGEDQVARGRVEALVHIDRATGQGNPRDGLGEVGAPVQLRVGQFAAQQGGQGIADALYHDAIGVFGDVPGIAGQPR